MNYSITNALFGMLSKRRITGEVARAMGMSEDTLRKQLRPDDSSAKFGADDFISLCAVVRQLGYGKELNGILREFELRFRGDLKSAEGSGELQDHVMLAVSGLGGVTDFVNNQLKHADEQEIANVLDQVRTKILPAVVDMEANLEARLNKLRTDRRSRRLTFITINPKPNPST